jgi:hypothetical protein
MASLTDSALPKMAFGKLEPIKGLNTMPKKPTTPRTNRPQSSVDFAKFFKVNIPDTKSNTKCVKSAELEVTDSGGLMLGSAFHGLRKSRKAAGAAFTLNELPGLAEVCKKADPRKPGASGKVTLASIAASSAVSGDLAISGALSDVIQPRSKIPSAFDSDSDSDSDSESDAESQGSSLRRSVTLVGDDEWGPALIDAFFQPPSELAKFTQDTISLDELNEDSSSQSGLSSGAPTKEFMDDCKKILRSVIPEPKKRFSSAKFSSEPVPPPGAPQPGRFQRRDVRSASATDVRRA